MVHIRNILVSSSRMTPTDTSREQTAGADTFLKPGRILSVRVLRLMSEGIADLQVAGRHLSVKTFLPLKPGQAFEVKVHADPGGKSVSLSPVSPQFVQPKSVTLTGLMRLLKENPLSRLSGLQDRVVSAGLADQSEAAAPGSFREAAGKVLLHLKSLAVSSEVPDPAVVRKWIRDGGQQWEARLAKAASAQMETRSPKNRAAGFSGTGERSADQSVSAGAPLKPSDGSLKVSDPAPAQHTRLTPAAPLPLAKQAEQDLKALVLQMESRAGTEAETGGRTGGQHAVSDVLESLQLLNRMAFDTQGRLLIPFPLMFGSEFRFGEMRIDLGENGRHGGNARKTVRVAVMLDMTQLGPVRADVALLDAAITGTLTVGSTETQARIRQRLPEWLERMEALGYRVMQMTCEVTTAESLRETRLVSELLDPGDTLHLVL
ncbi:MAG: hypothetical protein CSA22_09050 [Deltaproteobacteria bacterium]|nr:MAG: hypothetical protein CSA22_09050 [Deltaproteobacteria bacterium]